MKLPARLQPKQAHRLEKKISTLRNTMSGLRYKQHRRNNRRHARNNTFHYKFGNKSTRCVKPCNFRSTDNSKRKNSIPFTKNSGTKNEPRFFVKDTKNELKFLVDTGADTSVLPHILVGPALRKYKCSLSAVNGSRIKTYGIQLLTIDLGLKRRFLHPFLVASVRRPIIGADFLIKFGLLIDFKGRRLRSSKQT